MSQNIQAQAFQKGNINFDVGLGFGVYGTAQKQRLSSGTSTVESDTTDGAASRIFDLNFEYGISNKFGIGARIGSSSYFISDEDKKNISSVNGLDFGVLVNYHLLNSNKNDLFLDFGVGYSSLKYNFTGLSSAFATSATGSGSYFTLGIKDRIFFSDHIGILFNLGYTNYSINNIEYELTSAAKAFLGGSNVSWEIDWSAKGVNLGFGLAVKL
jgi:hypothetical protein